MLTVVGLHVRPGHRLVAGPAEQLQVLEVGRVVVDVVDFFTRSSTVLAVVVVAFDDCRPPAGPRTRPPPTTETRPGCSPAGNPDGPSAPSASPNASANSASTPGSPAPPPCSSSPPSCPPHCSHACSAFTSPSQPPGNVPAAETGPTTPPTSAAEQADDKRHSDSCNIRRRQSSPATPTGKQPWTASPSTMDQVPDTCP